MKDEIEKLLENVNGELDVLRPSASHQLRFVEKLKQQKAIDKPLVENNRTNYKSILAIAASFIMLLCFGWSVYSLKVNDNKILASVSPEMKNTEDFFTVAIDSYLEEINNKASVENKKMIVDTMEQLEKLEASYHGLEIDLKESGYDKRVISTMIKNFQKRIIMLESVIKKIDDINELKTTKNEHNLL